MQERLRVNNTWQAIWQRLAANPVALKELRGRMRGRRAFVILSLYLSASSLLVVLVYASTVGSRGLGDISRLADGGRSIFSVILTLQFVAALVFGPLGLAASINGERDRQTWDLLRSTLLTTHAIIIGKLAAGLAYVLLLIVSAIPLQAVAFLLGGVSAVQLLLTQIVLAVTVLSFGLIAIYLSSRLRSMQLATIASLLICLLLITGLPFLLVLADGLGMSSSSVFTADIELLLATTNPVAVLVNIMSIQPRHGRVLPTVGYVILNLATINVLYLVTWRRLRDPSEN